MDERTQPASLAAIQIAVMEIRDRQDYQGGVLNELDKLVRSHIQAEAKRPRMSPAAIKAWLGGTAGVLSVLIALITQWRVSEAGAESRASAKVATAQEYEARAKSDRDEAITKAVAAQAKASEEMWSARLASQKTADERAANMRVAPTRGRR